MARSTIPFGGAIVGAVIGVISVLLIYFNFIDEGPGMIRSQQQAIGVAMAVAGTVGALLGGFFVQFFWGRRHRKRVSEL